jgi:hypothetical protein
MTEKTLVERLRFLRLVNDEDHLLLHEAITTIAALTERAEKAEYELRRWKEANAAKPDWEMLWEEASDERDALRAQVETMREALEKIAGSHYGWQHDLAKAALTPAPEDKP